MTSERSDWLEEQANQASLDLDKAQRYLDHARDRFERAERAWILSLPEDHPARIQWEQLEGLQ